MKYAPSLFIVVALASCQNNPPTPPTVSSLALSVGATSSAVIGEPVALSATATLSDGSQTGDKTITWTSSQPDIASIDASGTLSAKRLGTVDITASVDGVSASSRFVTNGLEVSAGSRVDKGFDGVGSAFVFRYRHPTPDAPSKVTVRVTGPDTWNANKVLTLDLVACKNAPLFRLYINRNVANLSAVAGTYQTSALVNGTAFTASARVDGAPAQGFATMSMNAAAIQRVTTGGTTEFQVNGSWAAIPNVGVYEVLARLKGNAIARDGFTKDMAVEFLNLTVQPELLQVAAHSLDVSNLCSETLVLPSSYNVSSDSKTLVLP
ncbi:MAG: hypothetical protein HC933_03600 [Pleurocapsa sp. SU_196_0]|nr:hypothetical protein [Pleurocapsa sp. SU_196_0]